MSLKEAIEAVVRLKEHLKNGAFSAEQKKEIVVLYREVVGKEIRDCNCHDRYSDALVEIYSYLKRNGKMKVTCNYRLKSGVVIQIFGSSEVYTNDNLTDEVAATYIEKYPGAVDLFEHIPPAPEKILKQVRTSKKRNRVVV